MAAIDLASFLMFELSGEVFYRNLGGGLLVLLTGIVAFLLVRTLVAVGRRGICVPSH